MAQTAKWQPGTAQKSPKGPHDTPEKVPAKTGLTAMLHNGDVGNQIAGNREPHLPTFPRYAAARPPRGAEPKLRGSATGWMMGRLPTATTTDWKMTAAVAGRPLSGAGTARGPARTRTALSRHSGWEKDMLSVEGKTA
ncbi:unnamed protein product [Prorocentrum cordatum]|uniref:Uncharacterized protein n=1 Tax=Prorocentrum cordatum TaxID=2364126 RepID=A0ABN9UJE5_9DINO|nr:unnamed protein product [Polarella glacialis]